jgi:hypothetical protein
VVERSSGFCVTMVKSARMLRTDAYFDAARVRIRAPSSPCVLLLWALPPGAVSLLDALPPPPAGEAVPGAAPDEGEPVPGVPTASESDVACDNESRTAPPFETAALSALVSAASFRSPHAATASVMHAHAARSWMKRCVLVIADDVLE